MSPRSVAGALRQTGDGVLLDVVVRPGARETRIVGFDAGRGALRVDVAAPPERGRANRELLALLSKTVGGDVTLSRGASSRRKTVAVRGVPKQAVAAALESALSKGPNP